MKENSRKGNTRSGARSLQRPKNRSTGCGAQLERSNSFGRGTRADAKSTARRLEMLSSFCPLSGSLLLLGFLILISRSEFRFVRDVTIINDEEYKPSGEVLITFDSRKLIDKGQLLPSCSDVRFFTKTDPTNALPYFSESGCGTPHTMIWIYLEPLPLGDTLIEMRYGDTRIPSDSLFFFDDMAFFFSRPCDSVPGWRTHGTLFWELDQYFGPLGTEKRYAEIATTLDSHASIGGLPSKIQRHRHENFNDGLIFRDVDGIPMSDIFSTPPEATGWNSATPVMVSRGTGQVGDGVSVEVFNSTHTHDVGVLGLLDEFGGCDHDSFPRIGLTLCVPDSPQNELVLPPEAHVPFFDGTAVPSTWEVPEFAEDGLEKLVLLTHETDLIGEVSPGGCDHWHETPLYYGAFRDMMEMNPDQPWPTPSGICEDPGSVDPVMHHMHGMLEDFMSTVSPGESFFPTHYRVALASPTTADDGAFVAGMLAVAEFVPPLGWELVDESMEGINISALLSVLSPANLISRDVSESHGGRPQFVPDLHAHTLQVNGAVETDGEISMGSPISGCAAGTDFEVMETAMAFMTHVHSLSVVPGRVPPFGQKKILQELPPRLTIGLIRRKSSLGVVFGKERAFGGGELTCYGKTSSHPSVCGGEPFGECYEFDRCVCLEGVYGVSCDEKIASNGSYVGESRLHVRYDAPLSMVYPFVIVGDEETIQMDEEGARYVSILCGSVVESAASGMSGPLSLTSLRCSFVLADGIRTLFLRVEHDVDEVSEVVSSMMIRPMSTLEEDGSLVEVTILPFVPLEDQPLLPGEENLTWIVPIVVPIVSVLLVVVLVVVVVTGLIFVVYGRVSKRQQRVLSRLNELDDIDILLEERDAEKLSEGEDTTANLSIDSSLFEVEFGDVQLKKVLGKGGSSSIVYLAVWRGQDCAFKMLNFRTLGGSSTADQELLVEFEKEVTVLASVSHPNILSKFLGPLCCLKPPGFYGAALKVPRVGFLMELCPRGDLERFLLVVRRKSGKKYPLAEKIRQMTEVASAMAYLHQLRIIHRDLKPQNILVTNEEETRVMDFGLSKMLNSLSDSGAMTMRIGTSVYMAPELCLHSNYTASCDVFSYGVMLYVVLTENWRPYGSVTCPELRVAHDENFRPDLSGMALPEWLLSLMKNCWGHDPEARPGFVEIVEILKTDRVGGNAIAAFEDRFDVVELKEGQEGTQQTSVVDPELQRELEEEWLRMASLARSIQEDQVSSSGENDASLAESMAEVMQALSGEISENSFSREDDHEKQS